MVFDVSVALAWVLFLALFPMAFFWLHRAWRIVIRRDFSDVALKNGDPPPDPGKYAPAAAAINLVAGSIAAGVIVAVVLAEATFQTWTTVAALTIWGKFLADFIVRRHAHPFGSKRDKA